MQFMINAADCGGYPSLLRIIDYLNPEARKLTSCACPKMIPTEATPYVSTGINLLIITSLAHAMTE